MLAHHVAVAMSHDLALRVILRDGTSVHGRIVRRWRCPQLTGRKIDPRKDRDHSNLRLALDGGEELKLEDVERVERA